MPKTVLSSLLLAFLCVAGCNKDEKPAEPAAPPAAAAVTTPPPAKVAPEVVPQAAQPQAAAPAPTESAAPVEPAAAAQPVAAKATPVSAAPAPSASVGASDSKKTIASASASAPILRCCSALDAAAKKGGLTKNRYSAAAAVCKGLAASVKEGKSSPAMVQTTLRAQLQGVPVPAGC